MSNKKNGWFQSAFDDDTLDLEVSNHSTEPVHKKPNLSGSLCSTSSRQSSSPATAPLKEVYSDLKASNWSENFAPQALNDLSVHPKKIEEVQKWLECAEQNRHQTRGPILLLTGPSGSGKTVTLRLTAKERGFDINEWVNPVDMDQCRSNRSHDNIETYMETQTALFNQFLFKASRYRSIFQSQDKRLVLVEDFPNIFLKDVSAFHEALMSYATYGKSPLVFIVTDTKNKKLDIAYNLFSDIVQQEHRISHISFNAVSASLARKGLKRVASLMSQTSGFYKLPTSDVIESIILTSQGDIRNAVINLHFASQKDSEGLSTKPAIKSSKKTTGKNKKLKSVGCDESITLFHALGRVFNPKYSEEMCENGTYRLLHSPEQLTDDFISHPNHFVKMLHTNYAAHFKEINDLAQATNMLSVADVLMNEWREDVMSAIGLNITIRSAMVYNRTPTTGWLPVKGQKKYESRKVEDEVRELNIGQIVTSKVLACDYRTYAKLIKLKK